MTITHDDKEKSRDGKRRKGRRVGRAGVGAAVIHINFRSGDRVPAPTKTTASESLSSSSPSPSRDPLTDVFSGREVARLLGLSESRLRSLDRASIVSPTGNQKGRRAYTFQDLIALRATHGLLASHVRIREVAEAIRALKKTLPRVTRPLQELRIVSDGRRVVVRANEGAFEPTTGQLVLDFEVTTLRDDVVRVLRPDSATSARTAYDFYTRASSKDEDPATFDEAEELYAQAIRFDPCLAIAYTNLGNVRFRRGDEDGALDLYRKALRIDPLQPEAHYNIGYVALEHGEAKLAVTHFEQALESDVRFADAHFNLAMALERIREVGRAKTHWRTYLELEPSGTWAEIARKHLE
jgi:DNA-binding transcriptional MerR regulator